MERKDAHLKIILMKEGMIWKNKREDGVKDGMRIIASQDLEVWVGSGPLSGSLRETEE